MEGGQPVELKEIPMDVRNKAVREALRQIQPQQAETVLKSIGLTEEERRCLMDSIGGADLTRISGELHVSDRTLDRRRRSALDKLRAELEQ
jgi:FixJ family two-component response regulator